MDDRGFIFTTDATLALAVVIVITTSIVSYQMVPAYMGEDHQHLEALADSVLLVMEQDGTLNNAAVEAARKNVTGAQTILNDRLSVLIPTDTGYKMTITVGNIVVNATNNRGLAYSNDIVTKVRVISGPKEGWMGRAWYKIEKFEFRNETQNVTTTLWNFHNWLTNFDPWSPGGYDRTRRYYTTEGLINNPYWGSGDTPQNIPFSIPTDANIYNAKILIGACNRYNDVSYNANTTINGVRYPAYTNQFSFLNYRPTTTERMYNFQGNINGSTLVPGVNNFYVNFWNMTGPNNQRTERYDLAWYSIIGNYSTTFPVPKGILTHTDYFDNGAGMAVQDAQDLGGGGGEYGRIYNLNTGSVTSFTNRRVISWNSIYNRDHAYDDGLPFVITGTNGGTDPGCAVSIVKDVYVPPGNRIFDSFVVVNAYGGVDEALIEVNNGTSWRTIFNSEDSSARSDGYGNIPGIVYIPTGYLLPGTNNKVRITIWDDVPGNDYDLVGLTNCYVTTTYSAMNVNWINFPYTNHQNNSYVETQTRNFDIGYNAKEILMFVGVGTDSRNITVSYPNNTVLYSGSIPYYLNLASLDAGKGHYITTSNSTPSKYWLKEGTNYSLKVTVNGPGNAWESGDWDRNAEIFSGTRIAVLFPEFLRNVWADDYNSTPQLAMYGARVKLADQLDLDINDPAIRTEALYTGEMPNAVPVRLELWKH